MKAPDRPQGRAARRFAATGMALAALLVFPAVASATHDALASPEPLVLGYLYADQDNATATTQAGEPLTDDGSGDCDGARMGRTLWYRFEGTGRDVTIGTEETSVDTVIAVYDMSDGGAFVGCDDDSGGTGPSLLDVPTDKGSSYLLQVGSYDANPNPAIHPIGGTFDLFALSPPPNDDRADASGLSLGVNSGDNRGAVTEAGEDLTCETDGNAPMRKTVWKRFTVAAQGEAVISASGSFDTVMQVYRASGGPFACNDDGVTGDPGASRLRRTLTPGTYFVQVGGYGSSELAEDGDVTIQYEFSVDPDVDGDGSNRPADCNDRHAGIHPGASDVPNNGLDEDCRGGPAQDRDLDGHLASDDCNDGNAGIHRGAQEVSGNQIDENCDGVLAPPRLTSATYDWSVASNGLRLSVLKVRAPAGTRITVRCGGRRCFRAKSFTTRRAGTVNVLKKIPRKRRKRTNRSTLTLTLTQPNTIGKRLRLKFRKNKKTGAKQTCVGANSSRKVRCP